LEVLKRVAFFARMYKILLTIKLKKIEGNVKKRLNTLKTVVRDVPELELMYLFGSFAKGLENELSDIDIAFYLSRRKEDSERLEAILYDKVSSHLKTDEITFVSLNDAPLSIIRKIIDEGVVLYKRDQKSMLDFIERFYKLYLDFLPYESR